MDKFQDIIGKLLLPGPVVERKYGTTCEGQLYAIVVSRVMWYNVFVIIELDASKDLYKIVNVTQQLTKFGADKEIGKVEKIKKDKKKLAEILEKENYSQCQDVKTA